MKKVAIITSSLILLILIIISGYFVNIKQTDPVSKLFYKTTLKHVALNDLPLVVKKVNTSEVPKYETSDLKTNSHGISYLPVSNEKCYYNKVIDNFDKCNDALKQTKPDECGDNYGCVQDTFYVFSDNDVYAYTTPYPTRIVYHDPVWGPLPERISEKEFEKIIQSLSK